MLEQAEQSLQRSRIKVNITILGALVGLNILLAIISALLGCSSGDTARPAVSTSTVIAEEPTDTPDADRSASLQPIDTPERSSIPTPTDTTRLTGTAVPVEPEVAETPESAPSNTALPTRTRTPRSTPTDTRVPSPTRTPKSTSTPRPTQTATSRPTQTATSRPTQTATSTPLLATPSSAPSELRILTLAYDGSDEHVQITNQGTAVQVMSGWRIQSVVGNQWYSFPTGYTLGAGSSVRIHSGQGALNDPPSDLFWSKAAIWNNTGDKAVLFDAASQAKSSSCYLNGCP